MSYCSNLTDNQVKNVLCDEAEKAPMRSGDDKSLYYEAREECAKRGIDADMELRERGIRKP